MIVVKILLGLVGLGIVVFVHELGHFLAARLVGIGVEAFSIGWGKVFLKKKIGGVEYRLSVLPLGGYCKMRGEGDYNQVWEDRQNNAAPEKGSYLAASPLARIFVCFMGPFFNLLFAVVLFSFVWGCGFDVRTQGNRVVLASEVTGETYPSDEAGLKTGDRIIEVKGKPTATYRDIRMIISTSPLETVLLKVERDGETLDLPINVALDKNTGVGQIGIYAWGEPLVEAVAPGSPADIAGLRSGDRVTAVNGVALPYTIALERILRDKPPVAQVEFLRGKERGEVGIVLSYGENGGADTGISWDSIKIREGGLSFPKSALLGAVETWQIYLLSLKSFVILFKGVDLTKAVSGPVRITYMMGDTAAEGFGQGVSEGLNAMANFLALISIALCIMNLLPIPIVDGGMILLFFIELVKRGPLHPKFIRVFQGVGMALIFCLMAFALFGDILYLAGR